MARTVSPIWLLLSTSFLCMPTAFCDDFPGKGDRFAWSSALPYYNLANKYLEHGRYDDAIAKYEEAIYRYEYDPDFFINYGVAQRKCENYSAAEQAFKKAIELRGNDWQAWSNLANSYLKQNRLKETIACFQKAIKMQPPPPVQEKESMLKDIADINKILSMQAAAPSKNTNASTKTDALKSRTTKSVSSKHQQQAPTQGADAAVGSTSTGPSQNAPPTKKELSKSGWDWMY